MNRHAQAASAEADWAAVSAVEPCQVCGSPEGCRVGFEGAFICCLHERSERPFVTGGWLHPGRSSGVMEKADAPPSGPISIVESVDGVEGVDSAEPGSVLEPPTSGVRRTARGRVALASVGS